MTTIDITHELKRFEQHLDQNSQTILSAKFGDGKTYFLNEYIHRHEADTFFVVLHPVNYVVSPNEDIFEYIKRDILCSLVHRSEFQEINWNDALKEVLKYDTLLETVDTIASNIPLGNLVTIPFHLFKKVDDKFAIDKYFNRFKHTKGGLFEFDQFTFAIQRTIKAIQKAGQRCVLVIEDLDRLDPGHLFRILNVLSAHIDSDKCTNKFCFDNIVAVLDYDTTRHIFHHFYGEKANYEGYMSKFMSSHPFEYSITKVAHEYLEEYLKTKCRMDVLDEFPNNKNRNSLLTTIQSLSVRDIVHVLDGIENMIDPSDVELPYGCKTHSDDYITRFLAVLVRIGYKVSKTALVDYYSEEFEHFKKLNNYLLATGLYNNPLFEFNGQYPGYTIKYDGDYRFIDRLGGVGGNYVQIPVRDVVIKALDAAINKVKDGKQILAYKDLEE